jgi:hypothetical protein
MNKEKDFLEDTNFLAAIVSLLRKTTCWNCYLFASRCLNNVCPETFLFLSSKNMAISFLTLTLKAPYA